MEDKNLIEEKIKEMEERMTSPDFWSDKVNAQSVLKELVELKDKKEGFGKYDKGNAIVTIISGAGGDDAEDFSAMLLSMYMKYADRKKFGISFIHEHKNDHGGYRNVSFEIQGPSTGSGQVKIGPYGILKNEGGVHRLVRISPFNAK